VGIREYIPVVPVRIDFKPVFKMLHEIGYKGTLNIELKKNDDRLLSKQRMDTMLQELGIDYE